MTEIIAGWGELAAALTLFLASHAIPARPPVRRQLIAIAGERAYLFTYSIVSLLLLAWLFVASASAPFMELWAFEDWQRLVPAVAMPIACVLIVFALTSPNPLSLAIGWRRSFDPERPGIAGVVRHPVLWAALIWSVAHIVPNGDVAHLLLFGTFALLSIGGMMILDRRARRRLGGDTWHRLTQRTSNLPLLALSRGWRPRPDINDALRLCGAAALYVTLMVTHPLFAGVAAF
jgi:uncharacterized membrane protein